MWTYDATNLLTTTSSGRLNTVRLFIGDVDTADQQLQDEEILFALSENSENPYLAASFCCRLLASKYSRMVTTTLDGALSANYSDRYKQYTMMALSLADQAKKTSGSTLGLSAGGISKLEMAQVNNSTDRPSSFKVDGFTYPNYTDTEGGYV